MIFHIGIVILKILICLYIKVIKTISIVKVNFTLEYHNIIIVPKYCKKLKSYLLAISKDNKNEKTKITFTREQTIRKEMCNQNNSVQCPVIPFIDTMFSCSDQLFRQIESVVE